MDRKVLDAKTAAFVNPDERAFSSQKFSPRNFDPNPLLVCHISKRPKMVIRRFGYVSFSERAGTA
ncbi:MAG: hypothetical protein AB1330_13200 [Bacillota bacterium]